MIYKNGSFMNCTDFKYLQMYYGKDALIGVAVTGG